MVNWNKKLGVKSIVDFIFYFGVIVISQNLYILIASIISIPFHLATAHQFFFQLFIH